MLMRSNRERDAVQSAIDKARKPNAVLRKLLGFALLYPTYNG